MNVAHHPRERVMWTSAETLALVQGVVICGVGRWRAIQRCVGEPLARRSNVDLKDRWRTIVRAWRKAGGGDDLLRHLHAWFAARQAGAANVPLPLHLLPGGDVEAVVLPPAEDDGSFHDALQWAIEPVDVD